MASLAEVAEVGAIPEFELEDLDGDVLGVLTGVPPVEGGSSRSRRSCLVAALNW